jgi:hypothetical protein
MHARMHERTHHRRAICAAAAAALCAMLFAPSAEAQNAPPPALGVQSPPQAAPQPPAPPSPVEQPPQESPGLINELGKLWDALPKIKSPSEALDDIRGAGEGLTNLAKPAIMVTGRAACAVAANGAPDCKLGADRLCQSKGYKEGKSIDIDSAEKCSAKAYMPGRKREPGDCKTENYVIKALCQ